MHNNLPISLERPLNCICTHGRIKVNVFIQKMLIISITLCINPFALREKCPNTEFFWSLFSRIWTEYGELLRKLPYSECGKIRTRKNSVSGHFSRSIRLKFCLARNMSIHRIGVRGDTKYQNLWSFFEKRWIYRKWMAFAKAIWHESFFQNWRDT